MIQFIKNTLKNTTLYIPLRNLVNIYRQKRELAEWERNGRPAPPPHLIKQRTIREYAEKYGLRILVETGTYYGDMVEAMKKHFDHVYSIELSNELYEKARTRFSGEANISILHGDSGIELGRLIGNIDRPALFWLDGHYSAGETAKGEKDTPIFDELAHICDAPNPGHVVIIDDARCFGTDPAYPTLQDLQAFIRTKLPDAGFEVANDSIRITPSQE